MVTSEFGQFSVKYFFLDLEILTNYCNKKKLFETTGASSIKKPQYIEGRVHPHTLVRDVIGFICWKYINEGHQPPLKTLKVDSYSLYLSDPDGSIDWDLRPLEKSEAISRFGFTDYALVNVEEETTYTGSLDVKVTLPDGTYTG